MARSYTIVFFSRRLGPSTRSIVYGEVDFVCLIRVKKVDGSPLKVKLDVATPDTRIDVGYRNESRHYMTARNFLSAKCGARSLIPRK